MTSLFILRSIAFFCAKQYRAIIVLTFDSLAWVAMSSAAVCASRWSKCFHIISQFQVLSFKKSAKIIIRLFDLQFLFYFPNLESFYCVIVSIG